MQVQPGQPQHGERREEGCVYRRARLASSDAWHDTDLTGFAWVGFETALGVKMDKCGYGLDTEGLYVPR